MQQQKQWLGLLLAVVLGSGSGVGGSVYWLHNMSPLELQELARPDPATGTELRALAREINYHLRNHPDIVNRFDRRLTRVETQLEVLMKARVSP